MSTNSESYNGKHFKEHFVNTSMSTTGQCISDNYNFMVQQGWQCPVCKHIWSPHNTGCLNCNSISKNKASQSDKTCDCMEEAK